MRKQADEIQEFIKLWDGQGDLRQANMNQCAADDYMSDFLHRHNPRTSSRCNIRDDELLTPTADILSPGATARRFLTDAALGAGIGSCLPSKSGDRLGPTILGTGLGLSLSALREYNVRLLNRKFRQEEKLFGYDDEDLTLSEPIADVQSPSNIFLRTLKNTGAGIGLGAGLHCFTRRPEESRSSCMLLGGLSGLGVSALNEWRLAAKIRKLKREQEERERRNAKTPEWLAEH